MEFDRDKIEFLCECLVLGDLSQKEIYKVFNNLHERGGMDDLLLNYAIGYINGMWDR
jgi:hypothetical protein